MHPDTAATVSALCTGFIAVVTAVAAASGLLFWIDTSIKISFSEVKADQGKFEAARKADQDKFEAARKADQDKLEAARKADQEKSENKTRRLMFAMQRPKHASEIINDMRNVEAILCDAKYQK